MEKLDDFVKASYSAIIIVVINAIILLIDYSIKNWVGAIVLFFGAFSYFYNRHVMGKMWSIKVEGKKSVVKKGFFKHIRHPLYLGSLISCLGFILMTYNVYLLAFLIIVDLPYTFYRAKLEEKILSKSLKGYKEYMKESWMFIPWII